MKISHRVLKQLQVFSKDNESYKKVYTLIPTLEIGYSKFFVTDKTPEQMPSPPSFEDYYLKENIIIGITFLYYAYNIQIDL